MTDTISHLKYALRWGGVIVVLAVVTAMLVHWRAPGLSLSAQDALMRARGPLSPPPDVVIVAIDEASLKQFGRFPWGRSLLARALDQLATAQPKAVALTVLFSDATTPGDDEALAAAIRRSGNVVLAAQLVETPLREAEWIRPLPLLAQAAAGVGHGNVLTDTDGVARALTLREADDEGDALWALAVEVLRVGDQMPVSSVRDVPAGVLIGARQIPVTYDAPAVPVNAGEAEANLAFTRAGRLRLDYLGPAGSFVANTVSIADLIAGRVPVEKLRGKYVLVGVTAAAMGDRVASPFGRYTSADGQQHSALVPGVEVLANALTTILRTRFYRETPDWLAAVMAALTAAAVLAALRLARGSYEPLRQIGAVLGILALIVGLSYLAFTRGLILPPLVAALLAWGVATPLSLLRRALSASASLDARIKELAQAEARLLPLQASPTATQGTEWLPHTTAAKAETLASLQRELLARAQFVDRALCSVEDGLLLTDPSGMVIFANPRAAQILGMSETALTGGNLFAQLMIAETGAQASGGLQSSQRAQEALSQLSAGRAGWERELVIGTAPTRYYTLRLAVVTGPQDKTPLGLVATISEITKQRELQRTQNDVMALVTHEMKTPLTAIQGLSEVLLTFDPDAAKRRELTGAINEAAQRLRRMIDEYLDLTRLEAGAMSPRQAFLRVTTFLEQTLLLLDPVAAQRQIRVRRVFPEQLPVVWADADLLARAVTNLIANAIKYSPPHTEITVSAQADDQVLGISVADQGNGIAPEHLMRIFEKFYRIPRVEDADEPGTGLGLALVREIAESHGGRVTVESQLNLGSTFTIWLPLSTVERETHN